ncbi:MAG: spore coat protein CotJB [Clostridia bacterium]|nr:spore coat protein CotJB [Clostridia bacterium]
MNMNRENLMSKVQAYSFAVKEANLYLDAYPESKAALDYYNKYKNLEVRAIAEYEMRYGPINLPSEAKSWSWVCGPWPWQNEEVK